MYKVVVTGLGIVSSLGIGKKPFWGNLIKGKSAISEVTRFDTSGFDRHYAGEIKDFDASLYIPPAKAKFYGTASQYAVVASEYALVDANLSALDFLSKKIGVLVGTTMAEANTIDFSSEKLLKKEWSQISPNFLLNVIAASIVHNLGSHFKVQGINVLIPTACAAGNYAIAYACDLIKKGELDAAIVGGAEALSRIAFQGFQRLYAMSPDKCMPFDRKRNGMMLGEGAGILILESLESAEKRRCHIYAEVAGYGLSCDAHHMTQPNKIGIAKAIKKALVNSGVQPEQIGYISAHGTGTAQNDKNECEAVREVFGESTGKTPMSSIKSMLGHCMGAASAIEALTCCLALEQGVLPPTINFSTPDPECDIDCVPNKARQKKVKIVLNNAFAFGGNNCCVVFGEIKR